MGGIVKQQGWFAITPHKVSVCILIQVNSSPGQFFLPDPFSSVSEHNCFGMFLLSLIKSHVDIVEPKLSELVSQLSEIGRLLHEHLTDDLTNRLSSLSTPDDLFNFFSELRGVLGGPGSSVLEDDQISLDPSSNLGMFLRGCLLSFNSLSFEGVCHLLLDIQSYCKEAFESSLSLPRLHDFNNESEAVLGSGNMDLENYIREEVIDEVETGMKSGKGVPFHLHVPKVIDELIEGFDVATDPTLRCSTEGSEASSSVFSLFHAFDRFNASSGVFLRSNWQTQGYLLEQANLIENVILVPGRVAYFL